MTTKTKKEAQEILELGLNRWENYIFPSNASLDYNIKANALISEETMDSCWDIELILRLDTVSSMLGYYASEKTSHGKKYGRSYIQINSHTVKNKSYDVTDTILHELAHHIHRVAYPKDKQAHGAKWKWICQIVGAKPQAGAKSC